MDKKMMDKKRLIWLVSGLALAILIGALFLPQLDNKKAGSQTPPSQWQPGENGRPQMNMSEEERQTMMEARMQSAMTACQDKTENDACTMQGPRGDVTGTCKNQNGRLMCMGMLMRGNRSWEQ